MEEQRLRVKVYLEDTDAQGIVYHVNYLKYCERTRSDAFAQAGFALPEMQARGYLFVVYEMSFKFHKPARLHDEVEVRTTAEYESSYRVLFHHKVYKAANSELLFSAQATIVTIDPGGKLRELPQGLFKSRA